MKLFAIFALLTLFLKTCAISFSLKFSEKMIGLDKVEIIGVDGGLNSTTIAATTFTTKPVTTTSKITTAKPATAAQEPVTTKHDSTTITPEQATTTLELVTTSQEPVTTQGP